MLAGRKNPEGLSGSILVDGGKQPKNFKCMTGYVVQVRELRYDNILMLYTHLVSGSTCEIDRRLTFVAQM